MPAGRIGEISPVRPQQPAAPSLERAPGGAAPGGASFGEALEDALRSVEGQIQTSETTSSAYITGQGGDLHNVLLDMEKADLSFRTLVEVRNKLLDAYKEIMRMPV